jgi:hypothetical protein
MNMRESRGKAKQYTTINGRTIVIKDNFAYSNKGIVERSTLMDGWILTYHRIQDAELGTDTY